MALMLDFWDSAGRKVTLEGMPKFFDDGPGEDNTEHLDILKIAERVTGSTVMETWKRARDMNLTLEARLADGRHVIVRRRYTSEDEATEAWHVTRFESEIFLLKWLRKNSFIPVPMLFSDTDPLLNEGHSCRTVVMEMLAGDIVMNRLTFFSSDAKERLLESYASIALELFRLDFPQKIGTTAPGLTRDSFKVVPLISVNLLRTADTVFDTLEQYFAYLFRKKRLGIDQHLGADAISVKSAMGVLDKLENLLQPLIQGVDPPLRRCVLVHEDFHFANVLAEADGIITGVIDWEFHSLLPAILAADYPSWWSYHAIDDPRYATQSNFWLDSPEESKRLCDYYLQYVTEKDAEYGRALTQGHLLRSAVKWLKCHKPDPGAERLGRWMEDAFADA